MASDVAEFLWNKFLKCLAELESELSGTITISVFKSLKNRMSDFKEIKDFVNERAIIRERYFYLEEIGPYFYSKIIRVFYELNDALAECRIFAHECRELDNKLSRFRPRRFSFGRNMKIRLTKIKEDLRKLATFSEELDLEMGALKMGAPQEEIDNPLEKVRPKALPEVFGFVELSKKIEHLLVPLQGGSTSSSSSGGGRLPRVVGVFGIAGVGKTTLVQKVLESEQVKKKFEHILWLPFSGMSEGEQQYSKSSFETCIFDNSGLALEGRIVGLDKLLERLGQLLSDESYLIVLDDVCRKHINIMERLCSGLPKHNGGAVIVTTRLKQVAQKLGEQHVYSLVHVKPLDREICWRIFEETIKNDHADFSDCLLGEDTKRIEEIKDQCHGLPLVAKTLAAIFPQSVPSEDSDLI